MPLQFLLVDDDPLANDVLKQILLTIEPSAEITVATGGAHAWRLLDDPRRSFDVVFLDLNMPKVSGFDVLNNIRSSPLLRPLKVVICTGMADRNTVARIAALGAKHLVVKPCSPKVIQAKLEFLFADVGRQGSAQLAPAEPVTADASSGTN